VTTATDLPAHPAHDCLDAAARHARQRLAALAPALLDRYDEALPRAADTVGRRLVGALYREDVADARDR
jgi:hypothetical protein